MTILEYVLKLERDSIDLYEKYLALDYKKELKNVKYDSVLYEKRKKVLVLIRALEDTMNCIIR